MFLLICVSAENCDECAPPWYACHVVYGFAPRDPLFCVLPAFLAAAQDRVLIGASFGAFGLIALTVERAAELATRTARTAWNGTLQEGSGQVELTSSKVGTYQVSFPKRIADEDVGSEVEQRRRDRHARDAVGERMVQLHEHRGAALGQAFRRIRLRVQ